MKRTLLLTVLAFVAIASFGRKHVSENATVVADTIYYAENMQSVETRSQANYYRLLMTAGVGGKKQDVFQDFYLNGNLKAEGGYSFVDMSNDKNTVLDGNVTTYYKNGKEKWNGRYANGKRQGVFTLQMRDGSVATVAYVDGESRYDYFMLTSPNGEMQKRPLKELKALMD